jgi:hypothetical protein
VACHIALDYAIPVLKFHALPRDTCCDAHVSVTSVDYIELTVESIYMIVGAK